MKSVVSLICVLAFVSTTVARSPGEKKVWKGEDLNEAGIQTLSDLFKINTGWFNATNDDATIQFTRNGLAGPGSTWWPVYLNGTRMDLGAWDTKSLYLMPITFSQVDSVVIKDSPGLHNGVFTEKGGIFIYSRRSKEGLQVEADLVMGNKSGDPGPVVYTDKAPVSVHFQLDLPDSLDQKEVRINSMETVTYSSNFIPRFQWDAGISKKLWDERILFKLNALNILNRNFRNHPIGPQHTFTVFLRIKLSLPG